MGAVVDQADKTSAMSSSATPDQRTMGAAPVGARDEASAAVAVRDMFTSIAPRYDLVNHVLSMNIDRGLVEPYRTRLR